MGESESDDDMGRDTGCYPRKELWIARRNFLISWTTAVHRNPTINAIHEAHRRFPPRIRMRNCLEYPFCDDELPGLMPRRIEDPHRLDHTRGPVSIGRRKRYRSIDVYSDFLTKKIKAAPVKYIAQKVDQPVKNTVYYTCDNCAHKSVLENEAKRHLTSSSHKSCSKYSFGDRCDDEDTHASVLLCPRAISNTLCPQDFGWRRRDVTVICPVCDLILPDKILCGYHHQIHHPGRTAQCSFGEVLAVRDVALYPDQLCRRCNRSFRTQSGFVDHWYAPNSSCPSPFLLSAPSGHGESELPPDHVVEMKCLTCGTRVDRATPTFVNGRYKLPKKRKRKRGQTTSETPSESSPMDQLVKWTDGLSRICVNHAYLHLNNNNSRYTLNACVLRIRFVRIDKTKIHSIPPFVNESDDALLRFCLTECKSLLGYLEHFLTARRALVRQTKLVFNELRHLTGMDAQYSKINPRFSAPALVNDTEKSASQQPGPSYIVIS